MTHRRRSTSRLVSQSEGGVTRHRSAGVRHVEQRAVRRMSVGCHTSYKERGGACRRTAGTAGGLRAQFTRRPIF